jgi:DNA polymerase III delta subunit
MLKIFFGSDVHVLRHHVHAQVLPLQEQDVNVSYIDTDSYQPGCIQDALGAQSLFGGETLTIIESPLDSDDPCVLEWNALVAELARTQATFIVLTKRMLTAERTQCEKSGAELIEVVSDEVKQSKKFTLADALLRRDRKGLWLEYISERQQGIKPEVIIGQLWWQLKVLLIAGTTSSHTEAGIHEFPYRKAKKALVHFKPGELEVLTHTLITVYHDARAGTCDLEIALEMWTLTV